ncbi:hypothetical protein [Lactococcus petauri]|uniref:hypothetical protein n=1 Tax=Lactococcus petauri TaxID=1940789 RepID=UPI0022E6BB4C|nr:hypothetical protein [Lactococcus petauri]
MDMLTKLKTLSSQMDDPRFVEELSIRFDDFVESKSFEKIEEKELFSVQRNMSFNVASLTMMSSFSSEDEMIFGSENYSCAEAFVSAAA